MSLNKLRNIIDKRIKLLPNKQNSAIILNYYNYLIDKGIVVKSQLNNIQPVYYFANHIGQTNFIDVEERIQITSFLNTKINNDDPDKKYISTWNAYLAKLSQFYRWLYNADNKNDERDWITPEFMKIKKNKPKD